MNKMWIILVVGFLLLSSWAYWYVDKNNTPMSDRQSLKKDYAGLKNSDEVYKYTVKTYTDDGISVDKEQDNVFINVDLTKVNKNIINKDGRVLVSERDLRGFTINNDSKVTIVVNGKPAVFSTVGVIFDYDTFVEIRK